MALTTYIGSSYLGRNFVGVPINKGHSKAGINERAILMSHKRVDIACTT